MRHLVLAVLTVSAPALVACQSTQSAARDASTPAAQRPAADGNALALDDTQAIASDTATLTVGGLGCPLCANNIENTLTKLTGVQSARVDLSTGLVTVSLWGPSRPSARVLSEAVRSSGFTPTRIQTP